MRVKFRVSFYFFIVFLFLVSCDSIINNDKIIYGDGEVGNGEDALTVLNIHEESDDYIYDLSSAVNVLLKDDSISVDSPSCLIEGNKITITSSGEYAIRGSLSDGQIIVKTDDKESVKLIFNGVTVSNSSGSPFFIKKSKKTVIILREDTQNIFTDANNYLTAGDEDPNAVICSQSNLSICGSGSLKINANYNDGINCKDGLIIKSGNIEINSIDDGVRGKDYIVIKGGHVVINSTGDGLKSDNDDSEGLGIVSIGEGTIKILSSNDAISAQTNITVSGGDIDIKSGGGSEKTCDANISTKGIKSSGCVTINGGNITADSCDDALHSNNTLIINGGTLVLSSGDDALHSDKNLTINDGNINITKCYEGVESASVSINGGTIYLSSSDDGINVSDGTTESSVGVPFQTTTSSSSCYLRINGGKITVNSTGDGVDVNGSIEMNGGYLIVNGPTDNGNGAIDYDGTFKISGGTIIAFGSSGMAQAPGNTSTLNSLLVNFSSSYLANTIIHIEDATGKNVLTCSPPKKYQSLLFSSEILTLGSSFNIFIGGSATGTVTDYVYGDCVYTAGSKYSAFAVSSVVTTLGTSASDGNGPFGPKR